MVTYERIPDILHLSARLYGLTSEVILTPVLFLNAQGSTDVLGFFL